MRVIRALSFSADGERFAADVSLVQKVARKIEVTPVPASPREVAGIANIKGKVVTILSVPALLKRKGAPTAQNRLSGVRAVIFKAPAEGGQMGLLVDTPERTDETEELAEIDENNISPPPADGECDHASCVSGVAESGGKLYRILNIDSIISRFRGGDSDAASGPQGGTVDEKKV